VTLESLKLRKLESDNHSNFKSLRARKVDAIRKTNSHTRIFQSTRDQNSTLSQDSEEEATTTSPRLISTHKFSTWKLKKEAASAKAGKRRQYSLSTTPSNSNSSSSSNNLPKNTNKLDLLYTTPYERHYMLRSKGRRSTKSD